MYLVIGSTGNIGSHLVAQLLEQGQKVRALVRDASKANRLPPGTGIAVGDLDDVASLTVAAQGATGAFFMQVEPDPKQAKSMIRAAKSSNMRKVVVLSSIGTRLEPLPMIGARIDARDDVFRQSGLDVTYLRANALMSNALWWLPSIRDQGRVSDATDPGRSAPVDPFDVARVAALALTQEGHAGHGYILNGPEALTAREQVETLAQVLGRPIEFLAVTPEEFARQSLESGTPAEAAAALQNLNELFRAGRAGVLTDDIHNLTGTAPGNFRDWCERHVDAFR